MPDFLTTILIAAVIGALLGLLMRQTNNRRVTGR